MAHTLRTCRRTGCRWPAAASLTYRYATGQVWLMDLVPEADPSRWDLCPHHADNLTVPRGWECVDQRTVAPVPVEPSGRDLAREPVGPGVGAGGRGDRYQALRRELPRLAAELNDAESWVDERVAVAEDAIPAAERARLPVPSRDLAPMPFQAAIADPDAGGQLAIPVDELSVGDQDAVVVSMELAGGRRQGRA